MAKNKKLIESIYVKEDMNSENQDNVLEIKQVSEHDINIIEKIIKSPTRTIQLFKKTNVYKSLRYEDHDGIAIMPSFLLECFMKDHVRFIEQFETAQFTLPESNELFKIYKESILLIDSLSSKVKESPFMRILEYWLDKSKEDEIQQMSYLSYMMNSFNWHPEQKISNSFPPYFIAYLLLDKIDKYYGGSSTFRFDSNHKLHFDFEGMEFDEYDRIIDMIQSAYYIIVKRRYKHTAINFFNRLPDYRVVLNYIDRLLKISSNMDNLTAAVSEYRTIRMLNNDELICIDKEIEVNKKINDANKKMGNPYFSFLYDAYYALATKNEYSKDIEFLNNAYKEIEKIDLGGLKKSVKKDVLRSKAKIKDDLGLYGEALKDIDALLKLFDSNDDSNLSPNYLLKAKILLGLNELKRAETTAKKVKNKYHEVARDDLLAQIYKRWGKPLKQYKALKKIEAKEDWQSVIDDVVDLIPDLVDQLESYKNKAESENIPKFQRRHQKFTKNEFKELLLDYRTQFRVLNGLSPKDIDIDYENLFLHMVFIKRICDMNRPLIKNLSLPNWSAICDKKNISKELVLIFDTLNEHFNNEQYFAIEKLLIFGSFGLDKSKIDFIKNHHFEKLALEMNKYSWNDELIDETAFYNVFKDLGYDIFDTEEYVHNHQTKPEIVNLLVDLYDIKENDIVLDPACGTGRIFEGIISLSNESDGDKPYLYGIEEDSQVASFHHMKSILNGNERHTVLNGDFDDIINEVPDKADYVFFDPPLNDDDILNSFFENINYFLKKTGKAIIILPTEVLSFKRETWSILITENLIDTIIKLPKQYDRMGTGKINENKINIIPYPSSIMILDKSREISAKIRFFDASNRLRKMRKDYKNDQNYILSALNGLINSSLDCSVSASEVSEHNYDLNPSRYIRSEDGFKELSESTDFDLEEMVKVKIEQKLSNFAHLINTNNSNLFNKIEPLLKYLEDNVPKKELLYKNTHIDHLKDRLVQEQINSIREHPKVLSNSILTMKQLNSIGKNSFNPKVGDIRKEIDNIINSSGEKILTKHSLGPGMDKEDLKINFDKALFEQALLTQIENSCRVNKGKDDLAFNFKYNIRLGYLEIRYSNNGKAANSEIASTMFTDQYHTGYGEGGGFGQRLIAEILSFHKVGNLKGRVRMNSNAEKIFGFTMSFPIPAKNQR